MADETKSELKLTRSRVRTMRELALRLAAEHQKANGCWYTRYDRIAGLKVLASDTNGTSGIGRIKGIGEVSWSRDHGLVSFTSNVGFKMEKRLSQPKGRRQL